MMATTRSKFHHFLGPVGLLILLAGCGKEISTDAFVYKMGDKVPVGTMIYSVLESEWKSELAGDDGLPQAPKHRFLLLKLSLTNSGGAQVAIPMLTVENPAKEATLEVSAVKNLPGWLGMVRLINPAQTEQGVIVFDVP